MFVERMKRQTISNTLQIGLSYVELLLFLGSRKKVCTYEGFSFIKKRFVERTEEYVIEVSFL
jgi:hypothetical protein